MKQLGLRLGALALLFAWLEPAFAQQPTRDSVRADPDVQVAFDTGLADLFGATAALEGLDGPVRVSIASASEGEDVHRLMRIHGDDVRFGALALGAVSIELWIPAGAARAEVSVEVRGPLVSGRAALTMALDVDLVGRAVSWRPGPIDGTVSLHDLDLERVSAALPGLDLEGVLTLNATVKGTTEQPEIEATLSASKLTRRGETAGRVTAAWTHRAQYSRLTAQWEDDAAASAVLGLTVPLAVTVNPPSIRWLDERPHELTLKALGLTPGALRWLWRAPIGADFDAELLVSGSGSLDDIAVDAHVTGWHRSGDGPEEPVAATIEIRPTRQSLEVDFAEGLATLRLTTSAVLTTLRRNDARPHDVPLAGRFDAALPLETIAPYLPATIVDPEGLLTANVALQGTLGTPAFDGGLQVQGGAMTVLGLNRRLRAVDISARAAGDTLTLERLEARGTPGRLTAGGTLRLIATPIHGDEPRGLWSAWQILGELNVALLAFPVVQPLLPLGTIDSTVALSLDARPRDTHIRAVVGPTHLVLTEDTLPEAQAIPANPTVRFVTGQSAGEGLDDSWLAGDGHLTLDILLDAPLHLEGPDADLRLSGRLVLERDGELVQVEGGFDTLPRGRFALFGEEFAIRLGRLALAEGWIGRPQGASGRLGARRAQPAGEAAPLDLAAVLVARGDVADTEILVRIQGPVARPELILESVPPLPEYQIMTLLITGRLNTDDDRSGNVKTRIAQLVERYYNPSLERQLYDRLAIDKLGLGFGKSVTNPIVSVGKQLSREIYVETTYHAGAPPDANEKEAQVGLTLRRAWSIDTVYGDAGEGRIGVTWGTSFGGRMPPPAAADWGLEDRSRRRADDDADGVSNAFDRCRNAAEDRDGFADQDGCPDPDNDGDGVIDTADVAPDEPESINGFEDGDGAPDVAPTRLQSLASDVRHILFAVGSARLSAAATATLRACAETIGHLPGAMLVIAGHSDDVGSAQQNLAISEARAKAVRASLVALGVPEDAVEVSALGDREPIDVAGTREARAKNRRVVVTVCSRDGSCRPSR